MVDFDGFSCRKIYIQSSHGWHGFSQEAVSNHPCETPWNESTFGGSNLAFPCGEKLCRLWPVGPWGKLAVQFPTILIFERTKPALLAKEKHCCLIGILHIGVWNHPGWYNPVYTLNNQGFIHCFALLNLSWDLLGDLTRKRNHDSSVTHSHSRVKNSVKKLNTHV